MNMDHRKERRRYEDKLIMKEAFREAAREWLQELYRSVGKWTIRGIGGMLVVALAYFLLAMNGWHHIASAMSMATDQTR